MAQEQKEPNQIEYRDICEIVGRLYLESKYEISRLVNMLMELQRKLVEERNGRS